VGRGYATEAARALLASAFDDFGLDEVVAVAGVANPASTRVLEKARDGAGGDAAGLRPPMPSIA
jgi:RimJ/RimL family protein N-acetyltransferase